MGTTHSSPCAERCFEHSPDGRRPTREDLTAALRLVLDNSTNVTTAAAQTGRAYTTLRRKIAEGHIPAFKLGRDTRMWLLDVEALLAAGEL